MAPDAARRGRAHPDATSRGTPSACSVPLPSRWSVNRPSSSRRRLGAGCVRLDRGKRRRHSRGSRSSWSAASAATCASDVADGSGRSGRAGSPKRVGQPHRAGLRSSGSVVARSWSARRARPRRPPRSRALRVSGRSRRTRGPARRSPHRRHGLSSVGSGSGTSGIQVPGTNRVGIVSPPMGCRLRRASRSRRTRPLRCSGRLQGLRRHRTDRNTAPIRASDEANFGPSAVHAGHGALSEPAAPAARWCEWQCRQPYGMSGRSRTRPGPCPSRLTCRRPSRPGPARRTSSARAWRGRHVPARRPVTSVLRRSAQ